MIQRFDSYGTPITVNFKGESKFKTKVGGLLSLLLNVGIVVFGCFKLSALVKRENHTDSFNEIFHNLTAIGNLTGAQMSY
jgi:hypothetical protein